MNLSLKIRTRTLFSEIHLISITQNRIWVSRSFVKVLLDSVLLYSLPLSAHSLSHLPTFRRCGNVQCERTRTGHKSSTIAGIGPVWQERRWAEIDRWTCCARKYLRCSCGVGREQRTPVGVGRHRNIAGGRIRRGWNGQREHQWWEEDLVGDAVLGKREGERARERTRG